MNILITGGSGFVGTTLVDKLKECYKDCVIHGTYYLESELEAISGIDVTKHYLNLSDIKTIDEVLLGTKPDVIFHLAAQSSVKLSWDNPGLTLGVNAIGTINLLESMKNNKIKSRVLCVGSSEQYGLINGEKVDENHICRSLNPYGISKNVQEELSLILSKAYDIDIVYTRSFNHIGINQNPTFVLPDWCKQIAEIEKGIKKPVIYVGNLDVTRDFSDVKDVCQAYVNICKYGKRYEVYNVGSGRGVSLKYILKYLVRLSSVDIEIRIDEKKLRPSENPEIICDNDKLLKLKYIEFRDIESVLENVLDSWRAKI